jgi:hypothetical protein
MFKRKKKKKDYSPDEAFEQTFTAHIVKGNRQVVRREVTASKRFRVDEETYLIKPECIFLKNIGGVLRSVSYYREGNPNPYDFLTENVGIASKELDRIFAEDFFHIITDITPENRMKYVLFVGIINVILSLLFASGVIIYAFIG